MTSANQTDDVVREGANAAPPLPLDVDRISTSTLLRSFQEMLETTLRKVLVGVAAGPTPSSCQERTESGPSSPKRTGIDLNSVEKLKAKDLRVALLIGKISESSGLLIDTKTLAQLLAISKAHLYRLQAEQALLAPIQMGHVKRWRLAEVLEWVEAGCPAQSVWSYRNSAGSKKRGK